MFRFIKILINSFILVLALIGFNAIGGQKYVELGKNSISEFFHNRAVENAKKMGDFSKLNEEFQIDNTVNLLGYRAVIAEHKASGQKMCIIDSGKKPLLTREDIESPQLDKKLTELAGKIKYQTLAFEDIKVVSRGKMKVYNQEVPFAKFEAKGGKFPVVDLSGVVSGVKTKDGSEKLALAINERKKYSQLITDEFYRGISDN